MFDWDSLEKLSEEEKMEKFRQHLNDLKKKESRVLWATGSILVFTASTRMGTEI